jgi:hypothetical protein
MHRRRSVTEARPEIRRSSGAHVDAAPDSLDQPLIRVTRSTVRIRDLAGHRTSTRRRTT